MCDSDVVLFEGPRGFGDMVAQGLVYDQKGQPHTGPDGQDNWRDLST